MRSTSHSNSMTPLLLLVCAAAASAWTGENMFGFFGGSLIVTPEGKNSDATFGVELRSQQMTIQCHVNHYTCKYGHCGLAFYTSTVTVAQDSYGLLWCLKEVTTKLKVYSNRPFEILYPSIVNATDGSGYWTPNTRSSSIAWRMMAHINLGIRSDTGESNRPPITALLPILRVPKNCPRTFRLTVFEPDGDSVRCRVPLNPNTYECGLCGLPSGFSLDPGSCSLRYTYAGLTGSHSIELVLEDFPLKKIRLSYSDGHYAVKLPLPETHLHHWVQITSRAPTGIQPSTSPLSKLPLQFTVQVDSHNAPSCLQGDYFPMFLPPTPSDGASLPAFINRTLEIEVRSSAQYAIICDLIVTGPGGISKQFITTGIYVVKWQPTERDLGAHLPVCFISETRDGFHRVFQSEPRCVTVHVGHYEAIVTCNQTTMKVEVEKTYLIKRNEDDLHLKDASCGLKNGSNATHLVAVMRLDACGTHVEEDEDTIVYRNQITSADPADVISRHNDVDIAIACVYPKKTNLTLGFRHKNPYAFEEKGFGSFTFQFEFFEGPQFRQQVDGSTYPVEVYLKQMIYMQIKATSSIPNTELFVESCRATPYDNPESSISYSIIENGCVKDNTVQVYNGSKSQFRFGMEAFEFVNGHEEVYITCLVLLCERGIPDTRCSQGCVDPGVQRRKREVSGQTSSHVVSQGPFRLVKTSHSESNASVSGSVLTKNLITNLLLAVGVFLACGRIICRFRKSRVKYQPLLRPTANTSWSGLH